MSSQNILQDLLNRARRDDPVYITDVTKVFREDNSQPFTLDVVAYNDVVRTYALSAPIWENEEQKDFVRKWICALIFNILSTAGAKKITFNLADRSEKIGELAKELPDIFQVSLSKNDRHGYGKCLNVNERVLAVLTGGKESFCFEIKKGISASVIKPVLASEIDPAPADPGKSVFAQLPERAAHGTYLGIDIGGTDIKFAASCNNKLVAFKEYDWMPADFKTADEFTKPILLLTRLLRDAAALHEIGHPENVENSAFRKEASAKEMLRAAEKMESSVSEELPGFDGIGLSFPDVIINNLIVGGETTKTKGIRENRNVDYEKEFRKITGLHDTLARYTKSGVIRCVNDGTASAFTSAVEESYAGADMSKGFFADSLGTELGVGWIRPDGSVPAIPLEVYNTIIDLGSLRQAQYDAGDIRSTRNNNSDLAGSIQKYTGQSGVFRLAAKWLPDQDPDVWKEALDIGVIQKDGDRLIVPTEPDDRRKECLNFFMNKAADPKHPVCRQIFCEIGEYLSVSWEEIDTIFGPEAKNRTLYGRLVKTEACTEAIREGAARRLPSVRWDVADDGLANTPLMKDLAANPTYTVAQFAQAVGAIYLSCS